MDDHQAYISRQRLHFFEREEVIIDDFETAGFILDVVGGGEGVIGELKGNRAIAIELSRRELEEGLESAPTQTDAV